MQPLFSPVATKAQTVNDLNNVNKQLQQTNQQKKELQAQVDQKKREAQAIAQRKAQIEKNISATQGKINQLQAQIDGLTNDIARTNDEITQKQAQIDHLTDNRNKTLRSLYSTGSPPTWLVILSSSSISDVIGRQTYQNSLERQISANIVQTTALKRDLEDEKAQLESKQRELGAAQATQQRYKDSLVSDKQEKEQLLVQNSQVQKDLKQKIAEAQKYANDLSVEIVRITNQLRANGYQKGGGLPKGYSTIGMILPMDYSYISRGFGPLSERDVFGMDFHTGIDLVAPCGTPIHAAADGTVTFAAYSIGYGNNVRISHNDVFSTLYGHMSQIGASQGQQVKQNDVIGLEGSTGWSTGCHVHFEIRRNGFPDDPELYLGF